MHGPIDFVIVGFQGNKFDGSILKALGEALDKGVIGLVALAFISKDEAGAVTVLDINSVDDAYLVDFAQKYPSSNADIVDQDDIDEMADLLENNTAAGMLVVEHLWAKPLKQAIINANGVLLADGRIHPDAASEIN
ncbi:MAG: DUF6325 family protein [Candidatus Saccharimonadales bacterium]